MSLVETIIAAALISIGSLAAIQVSQLVSSAKQAAVVTETLQKYRTDLIATIRSPDSFGKIGIANGVASGNAAQFACFSTLQSCPAGSNIYSPFFVINDAKTKLTNGQPRSAFAYMLLKLCAIKPLNRTGPNHLSFERAGHVKRAREACQSFLAGQVARSGHSWQF